MKSNYKRLGNYIRLCNELNEGMEVTELLGISNNKYFQNSHTNTIGIDLQTYRTVRTGQFAYNRATTRNGDKISIALRQGNDCIVSPSYRIFEIKDETELLSEYLLMWFKRPEFDRYVRFKSHGSAHEFFEFDQMCEVLLPVPDILKQKEIVKEYNVIVNRISLNNQLIQKLEATAQAIYKQWFIDFEFPDENGNPYKSSGGEMDYNTELNKDIPVGWVINTLKELCSKIGSGSTPNGGKTSYQNSGISLVRSLNVQDYIFKFEDLAFIDDSQAKKLANVALEEKDVLLNITGVSVARCCIVPKSILPGRVNQHVLIIRPKSESNLSYYIMCLLCDNENKSKLLGISQAGSTREALTKSEIETYRILTPNKSTIEMFEKKMKIVFDSTESYVRQNEYLLDFKNIMLSKLATIEN